MRTKNFFLKRALSLVVVLSMIFTLIPTNFALAIEEAEYYYVVSSDKDSVSQGETLTLAITLFANEGTLANLRNLQYTLKVGTQDFSYEVVESGKKKNDVILEEEWQDYFDDGYGIGYIEDISVKSPVNGEINMAVNSGDGYFIDEESEIYNSKSTVVTKIVFTALKDISDVSGAFTLSNVVICLDKNGATDTRTAGIVQMSQLTAAKAIDLRITSLPSSVTYEDKKDVEKIRTDYEALSPAFLKDYVTKLDILSEAEGTISEIKEKINAVIAKIDAIGEVNIDSKSKIDEAEAAYELLTPRERVDVTNYSVLLKAKEDYTTLLNNKQAADDVVELINKIPTEITKENLESAKNAIDSARVSYDALVAAGIDSLVPAETVKKLTDAEDLYVEVKADVKAAEDFDKLVANLGPITLESEEAISNAEEEYENLTQRAKSYVTKKTELDDARAKYDALYEDEQMVLAVIGKIEALGSAEDITLDDKEAIEEAEQAYEDLRQDLKAKVNNKENLDAARARYDELEESKKRVDDVISLIENIASPVTLSSKAAIDAARSAYDLLDTAEQDLVTNYGVLTSAEAEYERLKADADQELLDRESALAVDNMIDALGEITLNSKSAIDAAYAAYNNLTEQAKGFVTKKDVLDEAKAVYDALFLDEEAVKEVIKAINDIGIVEYTEESYAKIVLAERMYNDLEERLQGRVTNYDDIQAAYDRYAALEEDENAVQSVIDIIDAIGEVVYTTECKERIEQARAAYEDLRDDLEGRVTNYQLLLDAETLYDDLLPEGFVTDEAVEAYGNMFVTVFNTIPDGKTVTVDGKTASVIKKSVNGEEKIYYVILSLERLDMTNVTVSDGASQPQTIGDVLNHGDGIWSEDASLVNKKAATMTAQDFDKLAVFDDDPFAYIRADVNGDGEIGAVDALIIARIAAGDDMPTKLIVGN